MANVYLPEHLRYKMGAPVYDHHLVDVRLRGGRIERRLVVRNGEYVTGHESDPEGCGDVGFTSEDIVDIRPANPLRWWPWL